jgi:hypothetical protein
MKYPMSLKKTPSDARIKEIPSEIKTKGKITKGKRKRVKGKEKCAVPKNIINIPRLITQCASADKKLAIGKISNGKTTFLTKFGWLIISKGDSFNISPNRLKIVRLAKRIRAKSICPSFSIPHFALKTTLNANVYMPNIISGLIKDQRRPKKDPLYLPTRLRLVICRINWLFLAID